MALYIGCEWKRYEKIFFTSCSPQQREGTSYEGNQTLGQSVVKMVMQQWNLSHLAPRIEWGKHDAKRKNITEFAIYTFDGIRASGWENESEWEYNNVLPLAIHLAMNHYSRLIQPP